MVSAQTYDNSGTYLINMAIPSPDGDDLTNEYFEFYGTPDAVVPSDLYFIMIEGDGESGKTDMGKVKEVIQLGDGTRTFGSNGILAIVSNYTDFTGPKTTNPFTSKISSDATIITVELTGAENFDVTSSSSSAVASKSPDIGYDGNMGDQSNTFMLVKASSDPNGDDIDEDNDGVIDASVTNGSEHLTWTIYDSFSALDADDFVAGDETGEYGYGQIVFCRNYDGNESNFKTTTGATIVGMGNSNTNYHGRVYNSTGYTASDWVVASMSSSWVFSTVSNKVSPNDILKGYTLEDDLFGELNVYTKTDGSDETLPTAETITSNELVIDKEDIIAYPLPMKNTLTITGVDVDQATVVNLNGVVVATGADTIDVADLASGTYILKITSNQMTTSTLIVK